jgi:hypothetical protein
MKAIEARALIKKGLVKKVTDKSWEVKGHDVREEVKKGYTLLLCDCELSSRYPTFPVICVHKQAVILFEGIGELIC